MVNYRRNRVAGGTYFFTVTLRDRHATFLTAHIDALHKVFRDTQQAKPFQIEAIVVLPDHVHTVWRLPADDADYAGRWRMIKSRFTRMLAQCGAAITRNAKGEYDLWQRRYWEHTIRGDLDLQRHVDYIHYNPVKHGLVKRVADWPYSSFHRYVRQGIVQPDWATADDMLGDKFGE
ncbi:MAG: transposase [Betaproteobacteria bacterium]|nr:transposase [Betaproteobacteria bacterium]